MYDKPIGVSILTNGTRLDYLKTCVSSILNNCYYRPLVVGIFDNGSTDETSKKLPFIGNRFYGVEWRIERSESDLGCAAGTNRALELVRDCEYVLHVESDFEHLPSELIGGDKLWLRWAVEFVEAEKVDYLYLRRIVDELDMSMHFWSRWVWRVDAERGQYLRCPGFLWSNNPHLHRTSRMYEMGVLPLKEELDGTKGTAGWCKPEMEAGIPGNTWIHRWGMFVHERPSHGNKFALKGCQPRGCKYGFFKDGMDRWCQLCDKSKDFRDMIRHEARYRLNFSR